ncbi:MAG: AmmeMemoRadiSam system radical SAM enzyme [Elusimicrobia bacterium]|nr:AmmeMemoRadiSam system radical SAM enzyme [Elusimicrobiota bacterium]
MDKYKIDSLTAESDLADKFPDGRVKCNACAHECVISPGGRGFCGARFNRGGKLFAPYGYVSSLACDPVEKKPFFHVLPGAKTLSFGMLGCNFTCGFCQNYSISQMFRDGFSADVKKITPEKVLSAAKKCGAQIIVSTYNEPLITAEWAREIFKQAKREGFLCAYVSNGHGTAKAVDYIAPYLDACKIDLKCFDREKYGKTTGGKLDAVLDSIRRFSDICRVEVVTLVIPGFNDSPAELGEIAEFINSVSPLIPWHVTAFHPDYKMTNLRPTPSEAIKKAVDIGKDKGLKYVYGGNISNGNENTCCHVCNRLLVERDSFAVLKNMLSVKNGNAFCPFCNTQIPGLFAKHNR